VNGEESNSIAIGGIRRTGQTNKQQANKDWQQTVTFFHNCQPFLSLLAIPLW
jgi:hypothetical protein